MRLTTRGQVCAGLLVGALTMLGGTQALPNTQENTPENTKPVYYLETYEDGSAVLYRGETELMTYPAESFCWTDPDTGLTYSCPGGPE